MKTGYFLPVSLNHRLVLLWGIIILSFERTLFYEFNKEGNWFDYFGDCFIYYLYHFALATPFLHC